MKALLAKCRGRRWRLRFTGLALLALMLQQLALVAYACPISEAPPEPSKPVMAACVGTEMPDPEAPALCHQHCVRDHVTNPDLKVPQVPPLALPARRFAMAEVVPPVQAQHYEDVPACQSDPPPTQRFCSLLI